MMAEHELDEGAQALTQQARMAMMIAGRMVEMVARRRADQDRAAADEARDRAATASRAADRLERQDRSATREATRAGGREQDRGRQAAHQVYAPLTNPRTFAGAEPETVAAGYTLATVWADRDPRAATATEQLDALCEDRWGVPARRLTRATGSTERESEVATAAKRSRGTCWNGPAMTGGANEEAVRISRRHGGQRASSATTPPAKRWRPRWAPASASTSRTTCARFAAGRKIKQSQGMLHG
ncbi:hypothetical protein [Ornithinimicrobium sp. INDO-MA30-4]|uniref:hypothetical protein n=1 Tax=Ornithinimicrobium sp. INDO-MA30-4 TaxID=2908651 RepID=UPI001F48F72E|nr:hypothetical protein [Ornithinimicrobium sp. INDO-MA30-4]UJH71795.1 hypothetical protein L0A91_16440 [Ornithinimicrobium sp. INDO-MA30-4]